MSDAPARSTLDDLTVPLGALLLYFLRFGYDYGHSDQDEFLPALFHRLDPTLLAQDWFVQSQASGFNIRLYFVSLLEGFSAVMPVWMAVVVVYLASWLLIATAVHKLAILLTRDRLAAAAATLIILVLTPQWTLGGNDLVHRMLVPSMLGWGLGLWGLVYFLREKHYFAAAVLGLTTWLQPLIGLQLVGLLWLILLIDVIRQRYPQSPPDSDLLKRLGLFSIIFINFSLPSIGPLIWQQFTQEAVSQPDGAPSLFYLLAAFRAPHHYLPFSFSGHAAVRFGLLVTLGVGGLCWIRIRDQLGHVGFIVQSLCIIAGLCLLGLIFSEIWPVLFLTKLQLFKTTVLAKLLLVMVICGAAFGFLKDDFRRLLDALLGSFTLMWIVMVLILVMMFGLGVGYPALRELTPFYHLGSSMERVEQWAETRTEPDAVFSFPLSFSGFRSRAKRAIVVNYKAYPFQDANMYVWYNRLSDMAPGIQPERAERDLQRRLDEAYGALLPSSLRALSRQYGFTYVVRADPFEGPYHGFEEVFRAHTWVIYRVLDESAPSP